VEKVVYLLWNATGRADGDLAGRLLGPVADGLLALDPAGLAVNIADDDAATVSLPLPPPADDPAPFAEVSIWLDCHDDRAPYEELLAPIADRLAGYLVTESIPTDYGDNRWASPRDWPDGQRSVGVVMLTLMERPDRLTPEQWYEHWYGTQTPMSTEIQPRTKYVRNAVARPLTTDAPPYQGIVEEAWPDADTINDPMRFYLADGDAEVLARNLNTMLESVGAMLDLDRIRLAAMSEYLLRTR
jgi:hypothetical protein